MTRNPRDFWTGLLYMVFGAGALIIARDYPVGTAFRMGPAYFPSILGVLLTLMGVTSVIRSFLTRGTPIGAFSFKGLFLITLSVVIFGFLVRQAGLAVALPLLVVISATTSVRFRWQTALVMAAALTIFCALVFVKGLGVPLPILGSWLGG
jgi:putative tricarboxylic transport membrane protein